MNKFILKYQKTILVIAVLSLPLFLVTKLTIFAILLILLLFTFFIGQYLKHVESVVYNENDIDQESENEGNADAIQFNWDSEIDTDLTYNKLMHINLKLRLKDESGNEDVVYKFESVIDDLRKLILYFDDKETDTLKWTITQLCVDFLPNLVDRYLNSINNDNRGELIIQTLDEISNKINGVNKAINDKNDEDFEFYANTIQKIIKG